jgi:hypothetical protein
MEIKLTNMKSIILLLLTCLSAQVHAQNETTEPVKPLILIDTLLTYNESMIIHPSKFVSVSTISGQQATALYGASGRFGVIKIQTLPNIEFLRLNAILDKFQIEEKYRKLRVCIDQVPVEDPEKLLADIKEIRQVEITYEKPKDNTAPKEPGFINIITQPVL